MEPSEELLEAIETSRQAEIEGWTLYMDAARRTPLPEVRKAFLSLAREEEQHLLRIEALSRGQFRVGPAGSPVHRAVKGVLRDEAVVYRERARRAASDAQALDLAIDLEDRAHRSYRSLAAGSGLTRVRAFFQRLSAEEHDHGKLLRAVRAKLGGTRERRK